MSSCFKFGKVAGVVSMSHIHVQGFDHVVEADEVTEQGAILAEQCVFKCNSSYNPQPASLTEAELAAGDLGLVILAKVEREGNDVKFIEPSSLTVEQFNSNDRVVFMKNDIGLFLLRAMRPDETLDPNAQKVWIEQFEK